MSYHIGSQETSVGWRFGRTLHYVGHILWEMAHFRVPYRKREDLDIESREAMSLPHGAVIAAGVIAFLAVAWDLLPK